MDHVETFPQAGIIAPADSLSGRRRFQAFAFGGLLLVLMNFSSPAGGMIDIPVTFFLKNRMHLHSNELAVFKLWIGLPLILGFVFGFIRDRWSPFGGRRPRPSAGVRRRHRADLRVDGADDPTYAVCSWAACSSPPWRSGWCRAPSMA